MFRSFPIHMCVQWAVYAKVEQRFTDLEAGQQQLRRILGAYCAACPEVGYVQGLNFIAGFHLPISQGRPRDNGYADTVTRID